MRRSSATKPMPLLPRWERTVEKKATSFSRPCSSATGRGGTGLDEGAAACALSRTAATSGACPPMYCKGKVQVVHGG